MNYEINVSRGGKHFFGTHERSLRSFVEMAAVITASVCLSDSGALPTGSVGNHWLQTK